MIYLNTLKLKNNIFNNIRIGWKNQNVLKILSCEERKPHIEAKKFFEYTHEINKKRGKKKENLHFIE